jgi:hypothetical protein
LAHVFHLPIPTVFKFYEKAKIPAIVECKLLLLNRKSRFAKRLLER